jgi:curli biogenesis system outer membrane secretion channel CsgG
MGSGKALVASNQCHPMRVLKPLVRENCTWLVAAVLLLAIAGCGYNQSGSTKNKLEGGYQWNSLYREDIQTVAVPIFTNRSYRRGVEFQLTEAVIKQLEGHAPYKVVPRERADTILEGQITDVSSQTIARDFRTNLPREQRINITVNLLWKDLRNGRILLQRKLEKSAVYYPNLGEGEFLGSQSAVEKVALAIVQELQADW